MWKTRGVSLFRKWTIAASMTMTLSSSKTFPFFETQVNTSSLFLNFMSSFSIILFQNYMPRWSDSQLGSSHLKPNRLQTVWSRDMVKTRIAICSLHELELFCYAFFATFWGVICTRQTAKHTRTSGFAVLPHCLTPEIDGYKYGSHLTLTSN